MEGMQNDINKTAFYHSFATLFDRNLIDTSNQLLLKVIAIECIRLRLFLI